MCGARLGSRVGLFRAAIDERFEQRATLAYPPEWLKTAFGAVPTASSVAVTPEKALGTSAVLGCIKILSESVATLPLVTYRRLERGKDRDPDYYLYDLLHSQPNEEQTAVEFWEFMVAAVGLRGNAYAVEAKDKAGRVKELWPLRPDQVTPERLDDGRLIYRWRPNGSNEQVFPSDDVFHIRGLSSNGVTGLSPIYLLREAIGLALAAEEHGARLFSNGVLPSGHFKHPENIGEDAHKRLKQSLEAYRGVSNHHKALITEEGMEWKTIGFSPEDSQMLESRKFQISEVARVFRVPLHKLQELDHATFSNIEHQSQEFVVDTLRPWLVRIEQAIRRDVYTEQDRQTHVTEFLVEGLLRGDSAARSAFYASGIQNGYFSPNDVRALENLNPYEGGDEYWIQANLLPASEAADPGRVPPGGGGDPTRAEPEVVPVEERQRAVESRAVQSRVDTARAFVPAFEAVFRRILRREVRDVERQVKLHLGTAGETRSADTLIQWLADWYSEEHRAFIERELEPLMATYAEQVRGIVEGELGDPDAVDSATWETFVAGLAAAVAGRWVGSSSGQLNALVRDAEDPAAAIRDRLQSWEEKRAGQTAGRETVQSASATTKERYRQAGVTRIRWVTTGDDCPFCARLNGKVIAIEGDFARQEDEMLAEGRKPLRFRSNIGHPPLHRGCDCSISSA